MSTPVVLDPRVLRLDGGRVLLGGDPPRLLRLRAPLTSAPTGALGALLVDRGLAHPRPAPRPAVDVVVVVPVRDRPAALDRCLAAVGSGVPVVVVDDASHDPAAVAEVASRHGARLVRLAENGGPAAARNAGLAATTQERVAFLDSDCAPSPGWLALLCAHLDDPRTGAAAPRVRAAPGRGLLGRYAASRGPLDMGPDEAPVRPGGRVAYVPTAALAVRRAALGGRAFDAALRFGEDVDLVWRLHDGGWRVRYDPRAEVAHEEPDGWGAWLRRRHAYGTSAAPLAARHGDRLAPLVLPPWPVAAWVLLAAGRWGAALGCTGVAAARLLAALRRSGVATAPAALAAARTAGTGVVAVGQGLGGAGTVVTLPLLLALLVPRRTRRTSAVLLLAPPLLEHVQRRPAVDPVRWTALRLLDDLAYGTGVWRGAWRARSAAALRPRRARPV